MGFTFGLGLVSLIFLTVGQVGDQAIVNYPEIRRDADSTNLRLKDY